MTRLHATRTRVQVDTRGTRIDLRAPMPGLFVPEISAGDLVSPDEVVGHLVVLGRTIELLAGPVRGLAIDPGTPRAVAYGDPLFAIDLEATIASIASIASVASIASIASAGGVGGVGGVGGAVGAAEPTATAASGKLFRAPTSGRYYGRPAPDKAPFVVAGSEIAHGATVCMLEVMKTFNRVIYDGDRARVRELLVADGADVSAGEPLLALDPIA